MKDIRIKLKGRETNRTQPFIMIGGSDTYEMIYDKFMALKEMGIYSAVLQYTGSGRHEENAAAMFESKLSRFDDIYFDTLMRMSGVCRELGMTYWVQDAAPFPTGAANGRFREKEFLDKGKVYLEERHTNLRGPLKNASVLIENFNGLPRGSVPEMMADLVPQGPEASQRGRLIGAVALKWAQGCEDSPAFDRRTAMDLTGCINGDKGILSFDLPEGKWRIFFLYQTRRGGRKYYMNLLDREPVRVQIDAVLKPHYEMLKEELGITWEGFFYDEPEVGNTPDYDFNCLPGWRPGKTPISLPWCDQMPELLRERLGGDWLSRLPGLWYDCKAESRIVRYHYMDAVTRLISQNYNGQVLPWCRERQIRYIGHALEDENSHARLGCGPGHFFRMQKYQDMSGIDLIAGQLLPGLDMVGTSGYAYADGDGEFYHYGIAKLASSEAHINPDKHGNSFCEVNAVYGDLSNAKFYKFLLDHLFVNGINHLVPVITDALKPDEGKLLFDYANRMCSLLQESRHVGMTAVLYHAEAEWSGGFQYFQRPCKVLAENQIDYDVVPGDALAERDFYRTEIGDGVFCINGQMYRALIIPFCEYIRKDVLEFVLEAMRRNVPVFFIQALPKGYCEAPGEIDWQEEKPEAVNLKDLAETLRHAGLAEIQCRDEEPFLRCCHIRKGGTDYYMVVNQEPWRDINTEIIFPESRSACIYDVMGDRLLPVPCVRTEGKTAVQISLRQYESRLYVFEDCGSTENTQGKHPVSCNTAAVKWRMLCCPDTPKEQEFVITELGDVSALPGMERYTSVIRYSTTVKFDGVLPEVLDLGNVCDSAAVILNGKNLGLRVAAPYVFDLSDSVRNGENKLTVEVLPSPARKRPKGDAGNTMGALSAVTYATMPQTGLLGPVSFIRYAK